MRFKFLHFKDDRLYLSREYIDTTDNEHIVTTTKNTIHTNQRTSTSTFVIMQGSKMLALKKKLAGRLQSVLGLGVDVRLVEPRSIERSVGKAKRVIDNRKL